MFLGFWNKKEPTILDS